MSLEIGFELLIKKILDLYSAKTLFVISIRVSLIAYYRARIFKVSYVNSMYN